jgi:hypothetical protein
MNVSQLREDLRAFHGEHHRDSPRIEMCPTVHRVEHVWFLFNALAGPDPNVTLDQVFEVMSEILQVALCPDCFGCAHAMREERSFLNGLEERLEEREERVAKREGDLALAVEEEIERRRKAASQSSRPRLSVVTPKRD